MEVLKKSTVILLLVLMAAGAKAQEYVAEITAFKQSYELENNGDYSGASEKLKAVYSEESYPLNLRLGWLNYMMGKFTESMAFYQKSIELMPLSIESRLGYALPASALGKWEAVIGKYKEILEIDPENSQVNYRMASYYYGQENYTKAYGYIEKVVNHYPFDYDSSILMAWIDMKLGKLREAKVLFNKCLMMRPDDKSAIEGLKQIQ